VSNEIEVYDAPITDDFLLQVADQAERRIDAVIKIKQVALKVTNARDWTDQNGNPYLQVSGSEKIANLFNVSWRIEPPICEEEPDGHFTYSIKGEFRLGNRTIEVEGTRSSKDTFFQKNDYSKDQVGGKYQKLPPSAIDRGDVKKAAMTNLFGNGITRILGIRNLTWDDLKLYANIDKESVGKVEYKKNNEKPPVRQPQSKSASTAKEKPVDLSTCEKVTALVDLVETGEGKKPWKVCANDKKYSTFSSSLGNLAKTLEGQECILYYRKNGQYLNLEGMEPADLEPVLEPFGN